MYDEAFASNDVNRVGDVLDDLGFGAIAAVAVAAGMPASVGVSTIDDAVLRILRDLSTTAAAPIDDVDVDAYESTKDALPAVLSLLRLVESYDAEAGRIVPDHAVALLALYISHNHTFEPPAMQTREGKHTMHPFAASPFLNKIVEECHDADGLLDADRLKSACADYDANHSMDTTSLSVVGEKLCKLVWKRTKEHPSSNTAGPIGISNVFGMLSLFHCTIQGVRQMKQRFESDLGLSAVKDTIHHKIRPGKGILSPTSTHYLDELSRQAIDMLHPRPLPLTDFCKLLLFVLTDGMSSPADGMRLFDNAKTMTHTGSFIAFASWTAMNYERLCSEMDAVRDSYIDRLDYEIMGYLVLKHVVVPLMNPTPQPLRIKDEYRHRYGDAKCAAIEAFSPHHGQTVKVETCVRSDFECRENFNELRINGDFGCDELFEKTRVRGAKFVADHLFALPTNELDAPLVRSKTYFCVEDGDDDQSSMYAKLKDRALGVRYNKEFLFGVNRIIVRMMLVCKLWHRILKPHSAHLAIAYVQEKSHFSDLKSQVDGSTALRGMPPLDTHLLGRSVKSLVYVARKYIFVDCNGDLCYRMQSFPANLILGNSMYARLRIAAVDGDAPRTHATICVHNPALAASAFRSTTGPRRGLHTRTALDLKSALVKFGFKPHCSSGNTAERANASLVSGMFLVDVESMVALDWMPTASSHSFRALNQKPLTALRLLFYAGKTADANDTMCMSAPFYVMSRKSTQAAVDVAASKRRKSK